MQKYVLLGEPDKQYMNKIGFFDSGCGGLTILKEVLAELPEYDYIYLGDNARSPYGNRDHDILKSFVKESVDYLFTQGCSLIIFACNTASAQVLRELQIEYLVKPGIQDKKILGVIRPLVEECVHISKTGRIGVVGTRATIESNSYQKELTAEKAGIKVFSQACPLLVPLIEECWSKKPETKMILKKYLAPLKTHNIDTLILGCTHYPFLQKEFGKIMGKKVKIPHPGKIVAKSLKDYLNRHPEIEKNLSKKRSRKYLTTGNAERFKLLGADFLGMDIKNVEQISLRTGK